MTVIKVGVSFTITLLRNKVSADSVVNPNITLKIKLRKNIGKRGIIVQILNNLKIAVTCACSFGSTISCIIVSVGFLNNINALLNCSLDKLVFAVVLVKRSLRPANNTNEIAVKVVLISIIGIRNKLIKLVVSVLSLRAVFGFQGAIAYIIIRISVSGNIFTLGNSLARQSVKIIVGILNSPAEFSN